MGEASNSLYQHNGSINLNFLTYAGEVTPQQAYELWKDGEAIIIDVRTQEERIFVGQIPGTLGIEWASGITMQGNADFARMLETQVPDKKKPVLFLCRSGARSHHAATVAAEQGYVKAYNILEGFEGDKNPLGQRRQLNGWVAAGLPWTQS